MVENRGSETGGHGTRKNFLPPPQLEGKTTPSETNELTGHVAATAFAGYLICECTTWLAEAPPCSKFVSGQVHQ